MKVIFFVFISALNWSSCTTNIYPVQHEKNILCDGLISDKLTVYIDLTFFFFFLLIKKIGKKKERKITDVLRGWSYKIFLHDTLYLRLVLLSVLGKQSDHQLCAKEQIMTTVAHCYCQNDICNNVKAIAIGATTLWAL